MPGHPVKIWLDAHGPGGLWPIHAGEENENRQTPVGWET